MRTSPDAFQEFHIPTMDQPPTTSIPSLLDFTVHDLRQEYPSLPCWVLLAFATLKRPQDSWTPEVRALLNIAADLPGGYPLRIPQDGDVKMEDQIKASEDRDLWRLSRDFNRAKNDGWSPWKGKTVRLG